MVSLYASIRMDSDMRLVSAAGKFLALAVSLSACDGGSAVTGNPRAAASPVTPVTPVASEAGSAREPSELATRDTAPSGTPLGIDPTVGLECKPNRAGWARTCTAPGYSVTGLREPCAADSPSFGAIAGDTPAHDQLAEAGRPVATLASGQFVCIQYVAEPLADSGERWLYVTAIAPSSIKACGAARCGDANAHSHWYDERGGECTATSSGYSAGCVSGWVPASRVDDYSMGLGGIDPQK